MRALPRSVLAVVAVLSSSAPRAFGDPDPAPRPAPQPIPQTLPKGASATIGLQEVTHFAPSGGFIDDVVATDDTRLAYVVADAAAKSELHVVTLATNVEQVIDLAPVTLHPIGITLVKDRALIVGATEDGAQLAAMIELTEKAKKPAGTIVYKLAPSTTITVLGAPGKQRVVVHRAVAVKPGPGTRHEVDVVAIENGKRTQAGRGLELDDSSHNKALAFRVNHWSDGYTRAFGIKTGEWDRKADTRAPDVEATYDVVNGKFESTAKIGDLFEQRRRFQALAEVGDHLDFVRVSWDNAALQVWSGGKFRAVELDQPLATYDPKSLQGLVAADGSAWIAIKVDPVNPDAVARKKADLEYLDLFHVGAGPDVKAVRKARLFAPNMRHRFGLVGDKLWLVERNNGFERGGKSLAIYSLVP